MALTFYYGSGSPFAWKVWLALEHKGIAYDLKLLSFDKGDTKAPAFRAINPRGLVPTIVDDGFALWESGVILEYLEEKYPQKPLLPKETKARATVRRLATEINDYVKEASNALAELVLYGDKPATKEELADAHKKMLDALAPFEAAFVGPYLAGELSIADFTMFPFVRMLKRIEDRKPGQGLPDDRLPPKLRAWKGAIETLPYYEKTTPPHWKK
ncbi:MAG TPA: glutathione S-transferase family protein [Hypericibacter adhaerens]|uniref:glutathione S-transferase family protein n=1 Tax=Hypericibacter adhaerens TaxID=2602016 RepID=UPI002C02A939|nr:glutathione S-transferase family protein [Hypericibacter adhaerens]HWA45433.1 glutathione S-transferase family protein [Hypericibacter adhaerens]